MPERMKKEEKKKMASEIKKAPLYFMLPPQYSRLFERESAALSSGGLFPHFHFRYWPTVSSWRFGVHATGNAGSLESWALWGRQGRFHRVGQTPGDLGWNRRMPRVLLGFFPFRIALCGPHID